MDIDRIKAAAKASLLRAIGFALLAIGSTVVGFSWDIALALETGAALTLLLCAILFFRALEAPERDYRKTETWLLLDRTKEWPPERLQKIIGSVLQDLYRRYAEVALIGAGLQWLGSVVYRLA